MIKLIKIGRIVCIHEFYLYLKGFLFILIFKKVFIIVKLFLLVKLMFLIKGSKSLIMAEKEAAELLVVFFEIDLLIILHIKLRKKMTFLKAAEK